MTDPSKPAATDAPSPAPAAAAAPSSPAAAPTAAKPAPPPANTAPTPAASEVRPQPEPRAPEPVPEPAAAPPPAAATPAAQALLHFVFRRDSWVQVREADGTAIFTRLNPAGTEQQVTGKPPLSLVIGNADGVMLTYGDQAIDLEPHIAGGGVARLTLK